MVNRVVQPKLVIADQTFFFEIRIDGLEILPNIFPERFGLSGLDMQIRDAPNWPNIIIWTLRIGGGRGQQRYNKQSDPQCRSHSFLQNSQLELLGPGSVPYSGLHGRREYRHRPPGASRSTPHDAPSLPV